MLLNLPSLKLQRHPLLLYALRALYTQLHTQLYLEEMQNCVDIRQFDMSKVLLEQALGRGPARGRSAVPQYLVLKVSSLVYSALHPHLGHTHMS